MNKLIKPKNMNAILSNGVVLHSRKQYDNLFKKGYRFGRIVCIPSNYACAVRSKYNPSYTASMRIHPKYKCAYTPFYCDDIDSCEKCFLNVRNYLNILKYIKHHGQKRKAKETKENQ